MNDELGDVGQLIALPPTVAAIDAGVSDTKNVTWTVPVAFTTFPGEIFAAPRSWIEVAYPGLAYFNQVDRGGHFAAWEEPTLFASEVRAAFKSLR